ncbi:glycosyltransferase family 2 protein [Bradyrhizobium sp. ISRA443]|uniref:glycosyltransferase family 2 protein n=1 Tax=unclassified Bradyrhizobium TaxID=2631580 RepID=UPI002479B58F|nr:MULTISPECIES: glycosyltransferase [unclassified Bradyrhizobium]WGR97254.1 glycosyltransferase family 2 protein [Bradyrhizobium sp. ISRA436]WGS04143.1 glycosyltransferase family 2 protein [Bradyrhizobium sp. ISRA437]WGS11026.1 glycosyltransferase family 2 protein [Bradyrhizobium sp. ISRA443]
MAMLPSITDLPLGEGVAHVAMTSPADIAGTELREGMTVFWHEDRPIGHVLMHKGRQIGSRIGHVDADFLQAIGDELQRQVKPTVSASVVICTRDRPEELAACLASLPRQSFRPREIIVVDNASRDRRTRDVASAAGVIYIREDRPGLDFARNTGVLRATGDIVAFTDDDVLLHPRWLERLVAAFDQPQIAAVTGLVLPAELATEAQRHFETYWGFGKGYLERDFDSSCFKSHRRDAFPAWDIGAGASMAFRRDVFERIGLFDERLDVGQAGCSGDSEYWYRLLVNGYTCRYAPSSVAFHSHRRTMEGLASQIYYYMRGHVAALLVQYERTALQENRVRAYLYLPTWYSYRLLRRAVGRKRVDDRFLKEEIAGCMSGFRFYHSKGKRE